jgi:hypothetical protein
VAESLDRLTAATIDRKQAIRRAAIASALQLLDQIGGIGEAEVREFVTRYGPTRQAVLVTTARLVDAYIDAFLRAHGETPSGRPVDVSRLTREVRLGTDLDDYLARPFVEARTAISRGAAFDAAMGQAAGRLRNMVGTDVQQAYRLAVGQRLAAEPSIPGYRRVLVGAENCVLCIAASTVRYRTDKLMPIHPGCDCSVSVLEPGMAVNQAGTITSEIPRLDQAKRIVREQGISFADRGRMASLKVDLDVLDDLVEVPHGELGPILAMRRHRNTTLPWTRQSRREFDQTGRQIRG